MSNIVKGAEYSLSPSPSRRSVDVLDADTGEVVIEGVFSYDERAAIEKAIDLVQEGGGTVQPPWNCIVDEALATVGDASKFQLRLSVHSVDEEVDIYQNVVAVALNREPLTALDAYIMMAGLVIGTTPLAKDSMFSWTMQSRLHVMASAIRELRDLSEILHASWKDLPDHVGEVYT